MPVSIEFLEGVLEVLAKLYGARQVAITGELVWKLEHVESFYRGLKTKERGDDSESQNETSGDEESDNAETSAGDSSAGSGGGGRAGNLRAVGD